MQELDDVTPFPLAADRSRALPRRVRIRASARVAGVAFGFKTKKRRHELDPRTHAELVEDCPDMSLDRARAQRKLCSDLAARLSHQDELRDLGLPFGKRVARTDAYQESTCRELPVPLRVQMSVHGMNRR